MGSCCSTPQSVDEVESANQFRSLDCNQNNFACREEMANYVATHAELWAMLSVNLGLPEDQCRSTATCVAMELASGLQGDAALKAELTEHQFHTFRSRYMLDGKGAQEFFHRCVFASFDKEGTHSLNAEEVDQFLETYYKTGSIFEGDSRLPPKEELKRQLLDGATTKTPSLTFEQIRDVIRGTTTQQQSSSTTSGQSSSIHSAVATPASTTTTTTRAASPASPEAAPPEETPEPATPTKKPMSEPEETPETQRMSPKGGGGAGKPRQRKGKSQQQQQQNQSSKPSEQAPTTAPRKQKRQSKPPSAAMDILPNPAAASASTKRKPAGSTNRRPANANANNSSVKTKRQ